MATCTREQYDFVRSLSAHRGKLPAQELRTIKGQALSGDLEGAAKGLSKCISAHSRKEHRHEQETG